MEQEDIPWPKRWIHLCAHIARLDELRHRPEPKADFDVGCPFKRHKLCKSECHVCLRQRRPNHRSSLDSFRLKPLLVGALRQPEP